MATKEELRKKLEMRARPFWHDFNSHVKERLGVYYSSLSPEQIKHIEARGHTLDNALKNDLLTEKEIDDCLGRASITGLLVMNPQNKGKRETSERWPELSRQVFDYQSAFNQVINFYDEHKCKRCVMHYFDDLIFNESSVSEPFLAGAKVLRTHPVHKLNELYFCLDQYRVIGEEGSPLSDTPEVAWLQHEIEKYRRLKKRQQKEGSLIPGTFAINEQMKLEMGLGEQVPA